MKWFKKDSNFYTDNRVIETYYSLGAEGIILYDRLLCVLAEQYDGKPDKIFIIHKEKLKGFGIKFDKKLTKVWQKLSEIYSISYQLSGENYLISYPKFLKKQGSYFRGATDPCYMHKDKDKDKDKEKEKEKEAAVFSFDEIWNRYPKRDGKKAALKHFQTSVKNQEDHKNINQALDNYLKSDVVKKGFVKNGSTWFNNWQDWLQPVQMKTRLGDLLK